MQILRARPEDAAKLTEIAFTSKRHWGYPERWIASWFHLLTIEPRLIAEQETYTAHVDGAPVGFYSLSGGFGRMRLEHLWVLPEAMRRGVGRSLFVHAVERARAFGCETLEIESDPNAAGFYEHLGARRVATTVTELEGRPRELPVLVYEIARTA
ncbi:MAG: GNAT family N-acetyltransferase [Verrucomicrobia bacterium]|nr:GNAT family N-acetyltransferase [Verrucomicrobiota bacterium]